MLYAKLEAEQRAVEEEEERQIAAISDEIDNIDKTIDILENMKKRLAETNKGKEKVIEDVRDGDSVGEQRAEQKKTDEKAFANYLRGVVSEERAENLTFGDNGAVVPTTIANRIIKKYMIFHQYWKRLQNIMLKVRLKFHTIQNLTQQISQWHMRQNL